MFTIEILESRIAPSATIAANGHSATYTDVDGDHVTVTVSKGVFVAGDFTTQATGLGDQLQVIDLTAGGFDGANLTVTVKKAATGDGLANIGFIDSGGHDLGAVVIPGDLGRISAGNPSTVGIAPGLKSLTVNSMGLLGTDTQLPGGSLGGAVIGGVDALTVKQDIDNAPFTTDGTTPENANDAFIHTVSVGGSIAGGNLTIGGKAQSIKIGGDLDQGSIIATGGCPSLIISGSVIGGAADNSGQISASMSAGFGNVKIGGSVIGGPGNYTAIVSNVSGSLTVDGSVIGGTGIESGTVEVQGKGSITILHDIVGGTAQDSGEVSIPQAGGLSNVIVDGSVFGGAGGNSGEIASVSSLGMVRIGHDLVGGSGEYSGVIVATDSTGTFARIVVGGSILGGSQAAAGSIEAGRVGTIEIGHDVAGGAAFYTGSVITSQVTAISIGGSLIGGPGSESGRVDASGIIGAVFIARNFVGPSISGTQPSVEASGLIQSDSGRIGSITIGGSIISGTDDSTAGSLSGDTGIHANFDIGSLTIKGSIIGHDGPNGNSPVVIAAAGLENPEGPIDSAIGKVSVHGNVTDAQFLAGYDSDLQGKNADAQIGTIKIGGNLAASSIVAGAVAGTDGVFGTNDDEKINGAGTMDLPGISSRIASIIIGGQLLGTPANIDSTDGFGFVAESFGTIKIGGIDVSLANASLQKPIPIGQTGDVNIVKIF